MLCNYEEIVFKAITYPVAVALYNLADELTAFQVKKIAKITACFFLTG